MQSEFISRKSTQMYSESSRTKVTSDWPGVKICWPIIKGVTTGMLYKKSQAFKMASDADQHRNGSIHSLPNGKTNGFHRHKNGYGKNRKNGTFEKVCPSLLIKPMNFEIPVTCFGCGNPLHFSLLPISIPWHLQFGIAIARTRKLMDMNVSLCAI